MLNTTQPPAPYAGPTAADFEAMAELDEASAARLRALDLEMSAQAFDRSAQENKAAARALRGQS